MISEILEDLAKVRQSEKAWVDSESEEEWETRAFKIGECLRPFYLVGSDPQQRRGVSDLAQGFLLNDTRRLFGLVRRNGFFPSPYSPIFSQDQYTDFASFILEFCVLVHNFWREHPRHGRDMTNRAKTTAKRAFAFLMNRKYRHEDADSCSWAGTVVWSRERKGRREELFTNTFFTAQVVIALHRVLEHPVLGLPEPRLVETRDIIKRAGRWIFRKLSDGEEASGKGGFIHFTWGLRALTETYHVQDAATRKSLPVIISTYLEALHKLSSTGKLAAHQQEYFQILSSEVAVPLYYEDRSASAGILLTVASLRRVQEIEETLERARYQILLGSLVNSILSFRNSKNRLWYREGLILSIHSLLVEAFLLLNRFGTDVASEIQVPGHLVRRAIRLTLSDDSIIQTVQQAIYQKLLELSDAHEKETAVDIGVAKLRAEDERKKGKGVSSVRVRSRKS
jgi:hypothetical protein